MEARPAVRTLRCPRPRSSGRRGGLLLECQPSHRRCDPIELVAVDGVLGRDAVGLQLEHHVPDLRETAGEPRLVRSRRGQEAVWILAPRMYRRRRRPGGHEGEPEVVWQLVAQRQDRLRRRAPAVDQDHRPRRLLRRDAGSDDLTVGVDVVGGTIRGRHAASPGWLCSGISMAGSAASMRSRSPSSHGGSRNPVPSSSTLSSVAKPGLSVASSKSTPPGSRK